MLEGLGRTIDEIMSFIDKLVYKCESTATNEIYPFIVLTFSS